MKKALIMILLVFLMAACSDSDEDRPDQPTATAAISATEAVTEIPEMSLEVRLEAETKYEQLRQLHTAIAEVWENLATGETAQCGATFEIVRPQTITGDAPIMAALRQAAIELESAVQLWEAECQNPRAMPPSDVINRGVLMVRAAGDALAEVEEQLAENP